MILFYKEISTNGKSLRMSGDNTASNLSQFGIQAFKLTTDANGKVIGISDEIKGATDGRWLDMPMVDTNLRHHEVTKCLKSIKGDITEILEETECDF